MNHCVALDDATGFHKLAACTAELKQFAVSSDDRFTNGLHPALPSAHKHIGVLVRMRI